MKKNEEVNIKIDLPHMSKEEYSEMSKRMAEFLNEKIEWILETAEQLRKMEKRDLERIRRIVSKLSSSKDNEKKRA